MCEQLRGREYEGASTTMHVNARTENVSHTTLRYLSGVFLIMILGIVVSGILHIKHNEKVITLKKQDELKTIIKFKTKQLLAGLKERMGDVIQAPIFYKDLQGVKLVCNKALEDF